MTRCKRYDLNGVVQPAAASTTAAVNELCADVLASLPGALNAKCRASADVTQSVPKSNWLFAKARGRHA